MEVVVRRRTSARAPFLDKLHFSPVATRDRGRGIAGFDGRFSACRRARICGTVRCVIAMSSRSCGWMAWLSLGLGALVVVPGIEAQYRAPRDYMKRIAPLTPPPSAPTRPVPVPSPTPPGQTVVPIAPADAEKAKAEKDAAVNRLIEFQKKRAEAGSATAQYDLGLRYLKGDGIEQNLVEARKWFQAAAKQEHPLAAKQLDEVKRLEDLLAAEAKAKRAEPAQETPAELPGPALLKP